MRCGFQAVIPGRDLNIYITVLDNGADVCVLLTSK